MGLDVEERWLRVLQHARDYAPDAFFLTGDFCAHEPAAHVYRRMAGHLRELKVPVFLTPGNHDDRTFMRNYFPLDGEGNESIYGIAELKGHIFLFLDTLDGSLNNEQEDWLEAKLREYPGAHIVKHHPPFPLGIPFMDRKYPLRHNERLLELLRSTPGNTQVFCGHYHSGRSVRTDYCTVHLCPPTSFFINPTAEEFTRDELPPAYQQLEWTEEGELRVVPIYVA